MPLGLGSFVTLALAGCRQLLELSDAKLELGRDAGAPAQACEPTDRPLAHALAIPARVSRHAWATVAAGARAFAAPTAVPAVAARAAGTRPRPRVVWHRVILIGGHDHIVEREHSELGSEFGGMCNVGRVGWVIGCTQENGNDYGVYQWGTADDGFTRIPFSFGVSVARISVGVRGSSIAPARCLSMERLRVHGLPNPVAGIVRRFLGRRRQKPG